MGKLKHPNVYINCSRSSRDDAKLIAHELMNRGNWVWWADMLLPAEDHEYRIFHEINMADVMIPVWSQASLQTDWESERQQYEVHYAEGAGIAVLPISLIDNNNLEVTLMGKFHTHRLNIVSVPKVSDIDFDKLQEGIGKLAEETHRRRAFPVTGGLTVEPIFADPARNPDFQIDTFVVMPFRDKLNDVYLSVVRPILESKKLVVKRGDSFQTRRGDILEDVWQAIYGCRFLVVELTQIDGQVNGNVYYELGIADVLGRPAILLSQTPPEELPFDIRDRRMTVYEDSPMGRLKLGNDLSEITDAILRRFGE